MTLLLTLLILAVVGLVAAVAVGRITGGLDEPASSLPGRGLPAGRVGVPDLERVRFSPALRGYRMDEVDDVLDRLTHELQLRDEEVAELRRALPGAPQAAWRREPPADGEHAGRAEFGEGREVGEHPQFGEHPEFGEGREVAEGRRFGAGPDLEEGPDFDEDRDFDEAFLPPTGAHDERGGGR